MLPIVLCAIILFCIGGIISYYFTMKTVDKNILIIATITFLYFIGSTFYVKTMIREKKNLQFKWVSWFYHIMLVLTCFGLGVWIVALAFIPSLLRAIVFYGRSLSPKQIGIYEIINSAIFFTISAIQIGLLT